MLERSSSLRSAIVCCSPRAESQLSTVVCDTPATLCQLSKQRHCTTNPYSRMYSSFSQLPDQCLPSVMQYSKDPVHSVQKSSAARREPSHSYQLSSATHQPPCVSFRNKRHCTTTPYTLMHCSVSPLPAQCLPWVIRHSKDPLHCVQQSFAARGAPNYS